MATKHVIMPKWSEGHNLDRYDTRCCLAKNDAKTPKLGTVSKKGKTLAVFIQSTFVNTNTRFLHFKAVFGQYYFFQ